MYLFKNTSLIRNLGKIISYIGIMNVSKVNCLISMTEVF